MARSQCSLKQAVQELKVDLTAEECEYVFRRKEFQDIYLIEVNKYRADLTNSPGNNKAALIGLGYIALEALARQGEFDKVIAGIEKIGKLQGWVGPDSNVNIFGGLSAKDIAEAKERIRQQLDGERGLLDLSKPAPEAGKPN